MKTIIAIILSLGFLATTLSAQAKIRDHMLLNGILTSIAAGDYESFLSHGTEDLAKNISEKKFREMMTTLRPVLLKGYYLKSTGSTTKTLDDIVFIWKLSQLGDHEEPNILIRVDSSAPGGKLNNFHFE
ncbi:hypothetical protein [Luteolibacter sp. AS25]|uniref:hypothetical protein n=1 Tax=Luteolibacter sp. AS25 TaxID=3135776 RepID=UPI00398A6676